MTEQKYYLDITIYSGIIITDEDLILLCFITSAVLFFQIELAKCKAKNLSGLFVYLASLLGNIVEEFVTRIVFSSRIEASFLYKSLFAAKSSVIDSITKSASFIDSSKSNVKLIILKEF